MHERESTQIGPFCILGRPHQKVIMLNRFRLQFLTTIFMALSTIGIGQSTSIAIPQLETVPAIDGDLSDWKSDAFSSGAWDMDRVALDAKYVTKRNRLNVEEGEDSTVIDLKATYFLAWFGDDLYFGAEVVDNVNDVEESNHEAKQDKTYRTCDRCAAFWHQSEGKDPIFPIRRPESRAWTAFWHLVSNCSW